MKNDRRQFLRNTSVAALTTMLMPVALKAKSMSAASGSAASCTPTTEDFYGQGPFYTPNAPFISNDQLAPSSAPGTPLVISGRVQTLDCTEFIPDTIIDVWHADKDGIYDNSGFNFRGKTKSNSQGYYIFETIYPGKYLNGGSFRPSHIHFKITPPGFPELTTQLYFEGDPDNATDPASSITSGQFDATSRIIPLVSDGNGGLEGVWDIGVNGDGLPLGVDNIHKDKGVIYNAFPNPFSDRLEIQYGVFRDANVNLAVYDANGRLVADLQAKNLKAEKYTAVWDAPATLPAGHYFVALRVNDLQVNYLKVVKM